MKSGVGLSTNSRLCALTDRGFCDWCRDTTSGLFNNFGPIRYLAIGFGDSSWDADPNNVTKPVDQAALQSEFVRFAVAADDFETSYQVAVLFCLHKNLVRGLS